MPQKCAEVNAKINLKFLSRMVSHPTIQDTKIAALLCN